MSPGATAVSVALAAAIALLIAFILFYEPGPNSYPVWKARITAETDILYEIAQEECEGTFYEEFMPNKWDSWHDSVEDWKAELLEFVERCRQERRHHEG